MNRILGIFGAILLGLFILVPVAAAADPGRLDEHVILSTNGDIVIPAGQHVDLLVVVNGKATVQGTADSILVINGSVDLVGSHAQGIVSIRSQVNLDAGSSVSGDIRTIDGNVQQAAGATVAGGVLKDMDLHGIDLAGGAFIVGTALFLLYVGWSVAMIFAALVLAGLTSRQVRAAEGLISHNTVRSIGAGFVGLFAIIIAATVAMVTIIGIPLGLGILVGLLPLLFIVGYLVAGIWIGERIVGATSNGVPRERPYLAAFVGVALLSLLSVIPSVGGIASFIGFGAVILLMWRTFRGTTGSAVATPTEPPPVAAS